jgi:hypothetical protein
LPRPPFDKAVRYPRSRIDKLGVKPGARVAIVGLDDPAFLAELKERGAEVVGRVSKDLDAVFVAMTAPKDLAKLVKLRHAIQPAGMIWVIWPKGRKEFREDDVRAYGPRAELVDVKVMAFSETLSGLKMVIPLAMRAPAPARAGVRRTPN